MNIAIRIDDLNFAHPGGNVPALERVSLTISTGESVALLGPSGAGKTTLLALLDGRLQGWRGRVSVLVRRSIPTNRRRAQADLIPVSCFRNSPWSNAPRFCATCSTAA